MMCDSSARLTSTLTSSSDRQKTPQWDGCEKTRLRKVKDVQFHHALAHNEPFRTNKEVIIGTKVGKACTQETFNHFPLTDSVGGETGWSLLPLTNWSWSL